MSVTIYHNPRCSKSRQTLALIEEKGIRPEVVLYLETPPDNETLKGILSKLGKSPEELMRKNEQEYKDHIKGFEAGDLLLWDNRSLVHCARHSDSSEPSESYRLTLHDEHAFY